LVPKDPQITGVPGNVNFCRGNQVKFIFVCPESDEFKIIEDNGVKLDETGNKIWDAKVELVSSCPFCVKTHIFHANELACPFT
jgi:hypothetical protein